MGVRAVIFGGAVIGRHCIVADGTLVQLLPEWTQPLLPVYVVYPPNRHLSAKVRAFVDWAAELFQREDHLQRKA